MSPSSNADKAIERTLALSANPVVRLTSRGVVKGFNDAASASYPWLATKEPISAIAPAHIATVITDALASRDDEVVIARGFGHLLRFGARDRLWIGDCSQADVFDAIETSVLVWEYDDDASLSAGDFRLVAANPASETNGPRWPMRSRIGLRRDEQDRHEMIDDLLLRVARTGLPADLDRDLPNEKGVFRAHAFPLPGKRIAVSFVDVTETRRSEGSYRAIFESSHDAIVILDPADETVLDANPAALEIYGRTAEEMIGMSMTQLSRWMIPGTVDRILREGFVRMEAQHLRSDGREIYFDVHATRISYRRRVAILKIMRDVTEERLARRALLVSEEKYRTLVANVPVMIWTADVHGVATFMSPGVEKVTGYSLEEMSSTTSDKLWASRVHPDDLQRLTEKYQALFRDGTPFDEEYRFLRKDGTWAWFSDQASHTYIKNGTVLADGVTQDLTERKRGELQQLALAGFGRRAISCVDERDLFHDACRTVSAVLEVPMASVLIYDADENAFRVAAAIGLTVADSFRVPNETDRAAAQTFASNAPITYTNLPHESRFDTTDFLALGTRAGVVAPISGRTDRYGVLHAHTNEPRIFSERETAFVQSMANVLAETMERSRAEREIERRTQQLAAAQAVAHIGSMEIDMESGEIEWSDELYRIAGMAPQSRKITLDFIAELAPPLWDPDYATMFARLEPGDVVDVERTVRRIDGTPRFVHNQSHVIRDPRTGRRRFISSVQDITDRREAETTLRDREQRLQLIIARLPVFLWSTDAEMRIISLSGSGFATDDPKVTLSDIIGPLPEPPEDGPAIALKGHSVAFDTHNGDRDLRVYVEPMRDDGGAINGTVGIAFDITHEKESERANRELLEQVHDAAEQWRETFDSIRAPLVILDEQRRVSRLNRAALELTRFGHFRDAIGHSLGDFHDSAIWKEMDALARASKPEGATSLQVDVDGRAWDLVASTSRRGLTIIIASEVTELVRVQEKLRRTERMSEMGALVAGVAHEVRNPLFGISATLDAFELRFGTEEYRGYIGALREQVERMSELMQELLEYGRPLEATRAAEPIVSLVQSAIASTNALAKKAEVTVRATTPGNGVHVTMDRPRLLQVFENLLRNAVQHSPRGGAVDISVAMHGDAEVSVIVEDRGDGFRAEDLPRIFDPFFTKRRDGTGLGLSLVRRIVDEHNGNVAASNRDGGGASMIVTLPVAEPAPSEVEGVVS